MKRNTLILSILAVLIIAGVATALFFGRTPSTTNDDEVIINEEVVLDANEDLNAEGVFDEDTNAELDINADLDVLPDESADDEVLDVNAIAIETVRDVMYTKDGFSPKTLTISVGDTVLWTNATNGSVYIAPDDHPSHTKYEGVWDDTGEGNIASAEDYSFTFTKAGTYTYHNHLNTAQTGTIVVE